MRFSIEWESGLLRRVTKRNGLKKNLRMKDTTPWYIHELKEAKKHEAKMSKRKRKFKNVYMYLWTM